MEGAGISRCHDEPQRARCLVAPVTHVLLRVIACRMGQGLPVIEHRAEIAPVRAAATSANAATFWPQVRLASRKLRPREGGSALTHIAVAAGDNLIDDDVGAIYNTVVYGARHGHILELMA
jgi:hypothetical protein